MLLLIMSQTHPTIAVILLAGGHGTRMKSHVPKQFLPLKDKPVALYSYEIFATLPQVVELIVVCEEKYQSLFPFSHKLKFARPGNRRQDSVFNGFQTASSVDFICVHDSARPFLIRSDVEQLIAQASIHQAATLAVPVKYTIKESNDENLVVRTPKRSTLWEIQTPQIIKYSLLKKGFENAHQNQLEVSDDVSLVELIGQPVKLVQGSYSNFKITTSEDWALANTLCQS